MFSIWMYLVGAWIAHDGMKGHLEGGPWDTLLRWTIVVCWPAAVPIVMITNAIKKCV